MEGKPYHPFDGDGMVHAIQITDSGCKYWCRYVETKRLLSDRERGTSYAELAEQLNNRNQSTKELFHKLQTTLDSEGHRMGKANTSLLYYMNRLFALEESDLPYEINPHTLETVGQYEKFPTLSRSFTAHPCICPRTKELFYCGYSVLPHEPNLYYGVVTEQGKTRSLVEIPMEIPTMIHDMTITNKHVILLDSRFQFHREKIVSSENPWSHDRTELSRLGIIPRYCQSGEECIWIPIKPCFVFHFVNAWEIDENRIIIYGCRKPFINLQFEPTQFPLMYRWIVNLHTKTCDWEESMGHEWVEFPIINHHYLGIRCQYLYACELSITHTANSILKYDTNVNEVVQAYYFHKNYQRVGGEPVFVQRGQHSEDDGYLFVITTNLQGGDAGLEIICARTMSFVARIIIPTRVPQGFHASWIPNLLLQSTQSTQLTQSTQSTQLTYNNIDNIRRQLSSVNPSLTSHEITTQLYPMYKLLRSRL